LNYTLTEDGAVNQISNCLFILMYWWSTLQNKTKKSGHIQHSSMV